MSGEGFQAGSDVKLWLQPAPVLLKTVVAADDGTFSATVRIPSGTSAGAHSIVAVGLGTEGQALQVAAAITVTAAPTPPPTTTAGPVDRGDTPVPAPALALALALASAAFLSAIHIGRRQRR